MQRVENDEDWTLMSEHECPGLSDKYGKDLVGLSSTTLVETRVEQQGLGMKGEG